MTNSPKSNPQPDPTSSSALSRRTVFAGAGAVGALAAVAAVLPKAPAESVVVPSSAQAEPQQGSRDGTGYQLTAHVQRYYQTARV